MLCHDGTNRATGLLRSKARHRTLDVLHVASASLLTPEVFFTFDRPQRHLARAVRLQVLPV